MSIQQQGQIAAIAGWLVVAALIIFRKRLGVLNAASYLVIWGSVAALEHPHWAMIIAAGYAEGRQMEFPPHARIHFFMAGIYALIGLVLLGVIARTLLKEGRHAGWYALLFAVAMGGAMDLIMGGRWFQHGSPLYFMEKPLGFGWEFFYMYLGAWVAALVLSYKPVFAKST